MIARHWRSRARAQPDPVLQCRTAGDDDEKDRALSLRLLRLVANAEPEWVNICHCTLCQRRTGSVLHAGAYFRRTGMVRAGESNIYLRLADSGHRMSFHFCPTCGSNVFWEATRFPHHYGVAVGAFADPAFPPPSFSVWEASMQGWVSIPKKVERFSEGRSGASLGERMIVAAPRLDGEFAIASATSPSRR
jgi:hypothetical protein